MPWSREGCLRTCFLMAPINIQKDVSQLQPDYEVLKPEGPALQLAILFS